MLRADIQRTGDFMHGGRLTKVLACLRSPGVHAVTVLRFGQWLQQQGLILQALLTPLYTWQAHRVRVMWGIDIPRRAHIGEGLYIGHFGGIVVSPEARIGKNCILSPQVTIGLAGRGEKKGCPVIGDNVHISTGAKIFGSIRIGDNVKIGANAVVHKDIPDNSIVRIAPGFEVVERKDIVPALVK